MENGAPNSVIIALNYQGIGLPAYLYNQTVSMILRAGLNNRNFTCDEQAGKCYIDNSCSQFAGFTDALVFRLQFPQ
jgi:hypothetical protein